MVVNVLNHKTNCFYFCSLQETIAEELLRITGEIRAREAVIREAGLGQ